MRGAARAATGGRRAWLAVAGYVALLFALQPRLGFAIDAFKARWGERALDRSAYAVAAVAALLMVGAGARLWRRATFAERLAGGLALALYAYGVAALRIPQERLHYLEYGLLAALVYAALSPVAADTARTGLGPAAAAVAIAGSIGLLDEILQGWLWERRYFDWADVWLNLRAGALGVLLAAPVRAAWRRRRMAAAVSVTGAARPPGRRPETDSGSPPRE